VTSPSTITLGALDGGPRIRHAFFTRQGGVSGGSFASLNCGFGSRDNPADVERNRTIAAAQLDLAPDRLVTCHQIHGTDIVTVEPWTADAGRDTAVCTSWITPTRLSTSILRPMAIDLTRYVRRVAGR